MIIEIPDIKDRNGKTVRMGDVIYFPEQSLHNTLVRWDEEEFCLVPFNYKYYYYKDQETGKMCPFEIVGNIKEEPNLQYGRD